MHKGWAAAGFLLFAFEAFSSQSSAQELWQRIPAEDVCRTDSSVPGSQPELNAMVLLRWLVSQEEFTVTARGLDYDRDGFPDYNDAVIAVMDHEDYCGDGDRCTAQDEFGLADAHTAIVTFLDQAGGANFTIPADRYPVGDAASPITPEPGLDLNGTEATAYRLLAIGAGPTGITCAVKKAALTPDPPGDTDPSKEPLSLFGSDSFLEGKVRVRGTIADLGEKLTDASSATLSTTRDLDAGETAYQVEGVLGYELAQWRFYDDELLVDLLPFTRVERRFSTGDSDEEVDTLSVGANSIFRFIIPGFGAHQIDAYPLFTTDSEADTRIGSLNLSWFPAFLIPGDDPKFIFPNSNIDLTGFGIEGFDLHIGAEGIGEFGRVFDDGGNSNISDQDNFTRVGGNIVARLSGEPGTIFSQFALTSSYRYLFGITGEPGSSDRFEVGLTYLFPDQENFEIGFRYVDGDAEETFEEQEFWEATLGIKF